MPLTTVNPALLDTQAQYTGFKNRIINGEMDIDQRNAGAAVSINGAENVYTLDRWAAGAIGGGSFTVQRSSTVPEGFGNSLCVTVTGTDTSLAASDRYSLYQYIEGFNAADFDFGLSTAQPVTISFRVRSSVTGNFGIYISNSAFNRSIANTITVNSANTWETKTVTFLGDTTGTWQKTNSIGMVLGIQLSAGTTFQGTANTWTAGAVFTTSSQTNLMATNGATFFITGVQLEKGSTATSFDYRPYGTELALCQRYYEALSANASGALGAGQFITLGVCENTARVQPYYPFKVQKRVAPSTTLSTISSFGIRSTGSSVVCSSGSFGAVSTAYAQGEFNNAGGGLIAGGAAWLTNHTGAATIEWSAEL
jgi:hypothetical protein